MHFSTLRRVLLASVMSVLLILAAIQGAFAHNVDPTVVIANGYALPASACQINGGATKTSCYAIVVETLFVPRSQAQEKYKKYVLLPASNASKDVLVQTNK